MTTLAPAAKKHHTDANASRYRMWAVMHPAITIAPGIATVRHDDSIDGKHDVAIEVVKPGTYETACGKGHWDCAA